MAKEKEVQSIRDYGNRIKRYRRRRTVFIFLLLLVIVAIAVIYLYKQYNKTFKNCETINKVANNKDNAIGYLAYDGQVVRYGKDGAEAIKKNGEPLWNGSYEMLDPIADSCGKYVAIADRGNKSVHIFNEKGEAGSFKTPHNIVKIKAASQGVTAILMEEDEKIYIWLYDKTGKQLTDNDMNVSLDGYPMDIAISQDGQKLGMIFLTLNEGKLINKVAFYNFGKVGQNLTDHFAGGFKYDKVQNIMPNITFLNNDTACVYKDNGFILYSIPELPEVVADVVFDDNNKDNKDSTDSSGNTDSNSSVNNNGNANNNGSASSSGANTGSTDNNNSTDKNGSSDKKDNKNTMNIKIKSIIHSQNYTGLVLEGKDEASSQLLLYNLKGKKVLDRQLKLKYNQIYMSGDEIILYDNLNCEILKADGKVKFKHTFNTDISAIYPTNQVDLYIMVGEEEIEELKLLE